ncbi:hypothetical protein [Halorussus salinus]|uniref:hypothetical protein n=1 Tax=Halorussus salinus TaxID=1364935 RepID=UPI0010923901|nr:hypothetical protein [Halorussus salinus]
MSDKNSHQDSSVESENETVESGDDTLESGDDAHVSPEILAESIRSKTDALHAQGFDLADQLERMAEAEEGEDADEAEESDDDQDHADEETEVNLAGMMTELLETASDLVEVAHAIEAARLRDRSK